MDWGSFLTRTGSRSIPRHSSYSQKLPVRQITSVFTYQSVFENWTTSFSSYKLVCFSMGVFMHSMTLSDHSSVSTYAVFSPRTLCRELREWTLNCPMFSTPNCSQISWPSLPPRWRLKLEAIHTCIIDNKGFREESTHIFLRGVRLNTVGTVDMGRTVCWLGLFIPAASFASTCMEVKRNITSDHLDPLHIITNERMNIFANKVVYSWFIH